MGEYKPPGAGSGTAGKKRKRREKKFINSTTGMGAQIPLRKPWEKEAHGEKLSGERNVEGHRE